MNKVLKGYFLGKRVLITLIFCILAYVTHAQTFFGFKAGANATKVSYASDVYKKFYESNFKPGFTGGLVLLLETKEKYGLYSEFLYSVKGKSVTSHANDYETNSAYYHYIDIPVLFRVKFNQTKRVGWYMQAGPEINYWLGGNGEFRVYQPDRNTVSTHPYTINFGEPIYSQEYLNVSEGVNQLQIGLAIGGGVLWNLDNGNFLALDLRYSMGHTYMGEFESATIPGLGITDNMEHKNNVISLSAVYYFDILEKIRLSKNKYRKK